MRPDPGVRRFCGLLHHFADLAGHLQAPFTGIAARLDEEHVSPGGGDGEAGGNAGVGGAPSHLALEPARPQPFTNSALVHPEALAPAARYLRRRLAADGRELPLEVPDAGLACVLARDQAERPFGEDRLPRPEAVRLELFRDEVSPRDPELLLLGVARQLDHVHPVEQRRRDRLHLVRGADEENLREVERQVEIVVPERRVLLGVEHLEHRARRVAAVVRAELVDLVDQEHRVARLGVAECAQDRPRHRADVRSPVAADLRLVADAAHRRTDETCARGRGRSNVRGTSCRRRAGRRSRGSGRRRRLSAWRRRGTRRSAP